MKKRFLSIFLIFTIVFFSFPIYANADMGPKPSLYISFENKSDELCYATLFADTDSLGPTSAWDGKDSTALYKENGFEHTDLDYKAWNAFIEYQKVDPDGYYFHQEGWRIDETKSLSWTYYPPSRFKIVLYYPNSDTYRVSEICDCYAFSSYFTVDLEPEHSYPLSAVKAGSSNYWLLKVEHSYDYTNEILSFLARVAFTLALEILIAIIIFKYCKKDQIKLILLTNAATQLVLNIALSIITYHSGFFAFIFYLVLFEIFIIVIEAITYYKLMPKYTDRLKKEHAIFYAVVANIASAVLGFYIESLFL